MPAEMKACIVTAKLTQQHFVLMGTDLVGDAGLVNGNSVSLLLHCKSENEINLCYQKLSSGGRRNLLPEISPDGSLTGNLTDKFGINWLLTFQK